MGPVDLDDRLDDPLLHPLHPIEFFFQDPPCLGRVYGREIIILPLDIHHDRQSPLGVATLFRRHLIGTGHCQIPSGPETDIIRQGPPCAVHEIRDTLDAGQLHTVPGLPRILVRLLLRGRVAGQKPLDHKLKEAILRGKLASPAKGDLTDLIDRVTAFCICSGEPHIDVVLPQPFQKAYETGIDPQDIHADHAALSLFELKCRPPHRIGKYSRGMMS